MGFQASLCWSCKKRDDGELNDECTFCRHTICSCGACKIGCHGCVSTESLDEVGSAQERVNIALGFHDKIARFCSHVYRWEVAGERTILSELDRLIIEMRSGIQDSLQFDGLYWSLAEQIKELIAAKSVDPATSSLLLGLRDKLIRLAPGRLEKSSKAFFKV